MRACPRPYSKVFVQLYRQNLIYKDKRLVNWDPKLLTAISDLEVQQVELKGSLWTSVLVEGTEDIYISLQRRGPRRCRRQRDQPSIPTMPATPI